MGSTGVLEDAKWVLSGSKNTGVNAGGVDEVARQILSLLPNSSTGPSPLSPWSSHPLHPHVPSLESASKEDIDHVLDWIFLVSVLNFSFWSEQSSEIERFGVRWPRTAEGKRWTGYWSLLAALHRALAEGIPITSPSFYRNITIETAAKVFRPDGGIEDVPLLQLRAQVMREAGTLLCEKHGGHFRGLILAAKGSAVKLVKLVVAELPSFRDEATYQGRRIRFYKRAQILVAETWAAFEGKGPGASRDIGGLTMFADYRVPQILYSFKTINYSPHLLALLRSHVYLENGSEEEVETRAASIVAVEAIRQRVEELLATKEAEGGERRRAPTAVELDFWLWDLAKEKEREAREKGEALVPHHRTRSCFY